jgi:hypothetical protein
LHPFIIIIVATFLVAASLPAAAQPDPGAGTRAGMALRQARPARTAAFGGASAAAEGGVQGVWSNPAALSEIERQEVSLTRIQSFANIATNMIAYGRTFSERHTIALSYTSVDYGAIEGRDLTGRSLGQIRTGDDIGGLSYAVRLGERFTFGATGRWMSSRLGADAATTFTGDAGLRWKTPVPGVTLGAAGQNLFGSLTFVRERFALPRTWRAGLAVSLFEEKLLLTADGIKPDESDWEAAFGIEALGAPFLSLRAGGLARRSATIEGTAGLGIHFRGMTLDYAWTPKFDAIDHQHRATLNVRF